MKRIITKNNGYFFDFDGWVGFGYAKLYGNNHKRTMWFLGFVTMEVIDRRDYPGIERKTITWSIRDGREDWDRCLTSSLTTSLTLTRLCCSCGWRR